jgi:hypothetical protein
MTLVEPKLLTESHRLHPQILLNKVNLIGQWRNLKLWQMLPKEYKGLRLFLPVLIFGKT